MSKQFLNSFQFVSAVALVAIGSFIVVPGCAVEATEPDGDQEESTSAVEEPSMSSESANADDAEATPAGKQPDDSGYLGKKCYAECTVQSYGGAVCPALVSGYGNTTFLGGCNKACNKAKGDAASKLPAGCGINNCNLNGC